MTKKVLIIGCHGQDGTLLFDYFKNQQEIVVGVGRDSLKTSGIEFSSDKKINILNFEEAEQLIANFLPHEIYYVAAYHHSAQNVSSVDQNLLYHKSFEVNVMGIFNILEAIAKNKLPTKVFYASSSHIFAGSNTHVQNEAIPYSPLSIYAASKIAGMNLCKVYRETKGVFASCGILYNHESFLRKPDFLTKKIVNAVNEIKEGKLKQLNLGSLQAQVDWGYAPDYTRAMRMILALDKPDDFVISSGQSKTVLDFVQIAFSHAGLNWKDYVQEDSQFKVRANNTLKGDSTKLQQATNWKPSTSFDEMVCRLFEPYDSKAII